MYWCDLCKCWLNDTKAAKLNHERGSKHQENLARSELSLDFPPVTGMICFPSHFCCSSLGFEGEDQFAPSLVTIDNG